MEPNYFSRDNLLAAVAAAERAGSTRCTHADLLSILDQPPALAPAYRVCSVGWYGPEGERAMVGVVVIVNGRGDTVRLDLPAALFLALSHEAASQ